MNRSKSARPVLRRYSKHTPFTDRVKLLVASGAGGDGASKMLHLPHQEFAGPGGGNGGRGGHVFLQCSRKFPDLLHLNRQGGFLAANAGNDGKSRAEHGRNGGDLLIEVPLGTVICDVDTQDVLFDLDEPGSKVMLLEGGSGGKGNKAFKSNVRHTPLEATRGLPGNSVLAQFELKSIADLGLIGLPNAGKSSLLSAVSTCQPKVAPYPFTTLHPLIGHVHNMVGDSCAIADLPGLIEGAYENRGLGHEFLRHTERTRLLAYVVDAGASFAGGERSEPLEPWDAVDVLRNELEYYSPGLSDRATVVFLNKMDQQVDGSGTPLSAKAVELQRRFRNLRVFPISAKMGIERGVDAPESGISSALSFVSETVFAEKRRAALAKRLAVAQESAALDEAFRASNSPAFASSPAGTAAEERVVGFREPFQWRAAATSRTDAVVGGSNADRVKPSRGSRVPTPTGHVNGADLCTRSREAVFSMLDAFGGGGRSASAETPVATNQMYADRGLVAASVDGEATFGVGSSLVDQQLGSPGVVAGDGEDGPHPGFDPHSDIPYARLPTEGSMMRRRVTALHGFEPSI